MKIHSIQEQNSANKREYSQSYNPSFQALKISQRAKQSLKKGKLNKAKLIERIPLLENFAKNRDVIIKRDGEGTIPPLIKALLSGIGALAGALGAGMLLPFLGNIGICAGGIIGALLSFFYTQHADVSDSDKISISITEKDKDYRKHALSTGKAFYNTPVSNLSQMLEYAMNCHSQRIVNEAPEKYLEEMINLTNGTKSSIAHRIYAPFRENKFTTLFLKRNDLLEKFALSKNQAGIYSIHYREPDDAWEIIDNIKNKQVQRELLESKNKDGQSFIIKNFVNGEGWRDRLLRIGYSSEEIDNLENDALELYIQVQREPRHDGSINLHGLNGLNLIQVHKRLKSRPDVLAELHSKRNNEGFYPLQKTLSYSTTNNYYAELAIKSFVNNLKDYPEVIKTVLFSPKSNGNSIYDDYRYSPLLKETFETIFTADDLTNHEIKRSLLAKEIQTQRINKKIQQYTQNNSSIFSNQDKNSVMMDLSSFPKENVYKILTSITNGKNINAITHFEKLDLFEINEMFESSPEKLADIYLKRIEVSLLQTLIRENKIVEIADFIEKISPLPEVLVKTKTILEKDTQDVNKKNIEYINKLIDKQLAKKLDKICEQKYFTADDILKILDNELVIKTGGEILNTPLRKIGGSLLMRIADVLPDEKNIKSYNKILAKLQEFPNVNYDQKDMLGISFIEKIMNSENEILFDFVKRKTFTYSPELDLVVNNITDNDFREKVLMEIKMEFPDIEEACRLASIKALKALLPQFNSPFYSKNIHGVKLFNEIFETYSRTSAQKLIENFGEYLPDYATEKAIEMPNRTRKKWIKE